MKWIIGVMMILILALTACSEAPESTEMDAPEDTGEELATPDDDAEEEVPAEPEEEPETNDMSVFDKFKNRLTLPEYYVKYDYAMPEQTTEMSQYFKGNKMRSDVISEGVEARTYMADDLITSCTKQNGDWMCFEIEETTENVNTGLDDARENPDEYMTMVTSAGTKTIAGEEIECFKITIETASMTYCLTDDGIPLFMSGVSEGMEWSMTAKEFDRNVANSAFEPPAAAMDLSDMMPDLPDMG